MIDAFSWSCLQVCQFVVSVNGLNVLHVDYRTVSNLILTGPRTIVMEVMEELECWAGGLPGSSSGCGWAKPKQHNAMQWQDFHAHGWLWTYKPFLHTDTSWFEFHTLFWMWTSRVIHLKNSNLCQCRKYLGQNFLKSVELLYLISVCSSHPLFLILICRKLLKCFSKVLLKSPS